MTDPYAPSDNWASVTFKPAPGYDVPAVTVHGSVQYISQALGVQDNDEGKVSKMYEGVLLVDAHLKKRYKEENPGKA